MKLHRLTLTNYRGITHRDLEFPDHGVVVISGANEIGKSSMLEALDLLLEAKDRSTKKEVKQVKPTHADVGAEVTADISTGSYRFVYRKRFHKRPETELTLLAPRREQLTGDEAHDRVRAMLAETVDMDLWQAQRVLQSASTSAVDLSGCDALSRALDVAAGEVDDQPATGGAVDSLLIDRVDAEFRRYFTATGRPTGEWAAAFSRLRAADEEVARCAAAVAEVDEAVRRHAALTTESATLTAQSTAAATLFAEAQESARDVEKLRTEIAQATVVAGAATDKHRMSVSALAERRRARADIDERVAAVTRLQTESDAAADDLDTASKMQKEAEQVAAAARMAVEAGHRRVEAVRATVQRLCDREELDRLAGQLTTLQRHQRELDEVQRDLGAITLTAALMAAVEDAAAAVDRARAAADQASAHLDLVASTDLEVTIGEDRVRLAAGQDWSAAVSGPTGVDVAGVLSLRVVPGAPAAATQATLEDARARLAAVLEQAGATDLATARHTDQRRRELSGAAERLRGILEVLTAEHTLDALAARVDALRAALPADDGLWDADAGGPRDLAALRAELDAASAEHQQLVRDCETHRKVAEETTKLLSERELRAARAKEKLDAAQAELTLAMQRLAAQRALTPDDDLALAAEADAEAVRAADSLVARLSDDLERHQPDAVAAALEQAQRQHDRLDSERQHAAESLREVATQLKVYGTQGRQGRLDEAETERQHAEAEHLRMQRRAKAAELLRSVMVRHRDATRQRYVDPYRGEVERLGRIVFGDSFEIDVDADLRIQQRTLSGRTVPYESLSGGAKEQLGIVARL
ncbi:AAA family ATPase, partial [Mycolicibacterium poriferae]|uniref:AAA family ATPase n=1 Tax=Mycolicibacterium poriferae TaxID=39694 RepID=UPI0024B92270